MQKLNFEFKAQAHNLKNAEEILLQQPLTRFIGEDRQIDTYFNVAKGRLKMREGNIENALIFYERSDFAGAKQSDVQLYQHQPNPSLKSLLIKLHGVKTVVDKRRSIYFIENVKFHFDTVSQLGTFIEVEAIDDDGTIGLSKLQDQCKFFQKLLNIDDTDMISKSYSDLLLELQ